MRHLIAVALCCMFFVHPGQSQTPKEVADTLWSAQKPELKKLFHKLHLPDEIAQYYSLDDIDGYRWFNLLPQDNGSLHILVLPCSSIMGSPILLLRYSNGTWELRDREGMDCHYDNSASAQLVQLTSTKQYDLLLHHSCEGRGSGFVEQFTRVLRIQDGKFHQVFSSTDVLHAFDGDGEPHGDFKESTFLPTKRYVLEETRVSTDYDQNDQPRLAHATIQRREHIWNGRQFSSSAWTVLK